MANSLNLTVNIALANVSKIKITRVTSIDEDAKRMVVEVDVIASGNLFYRSFSLEVLNGSMAGLAAHPAPASINDAVTQVQLGGAGVATAFDVVLAAYHAAGGDKRGNVLTAMKGISGVVAGSIFPPDTTLPALPAGTVS